MQLINKSSLFSLIIVVLITTFTYSQPGRGRGYQQMKEKLNLTETQENQLEKLRTDHQMYMVDLRAKLQKSRLEVREIIRKDDFKRSEYLSAQDKSAKINDEIRSATDKHRMDVFDILNKDQRKTFLEFSGKFGAKNRHSLESGRWRDNCCNPLYKYRMRSKWQ